jgi:hypothetical protein
VIEGRCYCGAAAFEVRGPFAYALNCHCSQCRRVTGAAFKSFAGVARERLRVTRGEMLVVGDAAANHDCHCARCGSWLFSVVRDGAFAHVAMGALEGDPGIRPTAHIFVGSKAPWFEITDDLPRFEGFPE